MSRFIFSVIFLACCMAFVESASAEHPPGTLLWQDRFAAGEDPTARVTVNGTRAFVAGKAPSAAGNSTGWLVRAYDAASGSVLWQDAVTGFSGIENKAQTVASKRDLVLAGGFTSIASFADFALVRAYDARTGTLRWEDRFNFGSSFAAVNQIAFAEDDDPLTVLAVGRGVTPDFKTEWFIRAYDARTGVFLWQDVLDGGRFNDGLSVTSHKGRAFVSGFTLDATPASRHFTVRAYDARTGILIWQDRVASGNLSFFGGDAAVQVAAEDNRVV